MRRSHFLFIISQIKFPTISLLLLLSMQGCQKSDENKPDPPAPPVSLAAATVSATKVILVWADKSTDETGFKVERKTAAGAFAVIATTAANVTTYNDIAVVANTAYTYRVASYNQTGNSAYTNEISVTARNAATVPVLTTNNIDSITATTATCGGNITSDGGDSVTARGIVWGTAQNPTTALTTKTNNGTGTGNFSGTLSGLSPTTTYYVRAYAVNSAGTAYGNQVSFYTDSLKQFTVLTGSLVSRTATSVLATGNLMFTTGVTIVSKGFVWNTTPGATVSLPTKIAAGSGTGAYNATITGLNANTTYYIRAYATTNLGTSYGNEVIFYGWMAKNLEVTTYRNGDVIPQVTDPAQWANLTTGAWCYLDNSTAYGNIYGKLYNWYAFTDPRGLAPAGWHLPSKAEWDDYAVSLGGEYYIGGKMKATTYWISPNTGATNESGFTGLPGGLRNADGTFAAYDNYGAWYSTEPPNGASVWSRSLSAYGIVLTRNFGDKRIGLSVRCIKD